MLLISSGLSMLRRRKNIKVQRRNTCPRPRSAETENPGLCDPPPCPLSPASGPAPGPSPQHPSLLGPALCILGSGKGRISLQAPCCSNASCQQGRPIADLPGPRSRSSPSRKACGRGPMLESSRCRGSGMDPFRRRMSCHASFYAPLLSDNAPVINFTAFTFERGQWRL